MPLQLILTKDGSHSIAVRDRLTYHSVHGAIQESRHVFIEAGLKTVLAGSGPLRVFEFGFGTGLNALLTLIETAGSGRPVHYETVDVAPLPGGMPQQLNYCVQLQRPDLQEVFDRMHTLPWGQDSELAPGFTLLKVAGDGAAYQLRQDADLVYYDAFDPAVQPSLWTEEVFARLAARMTPGAVLVTYSCKGTVRRALQSAGLVAGKLSGPPGKREILRARKLA